MGNEVGSIPELKRALLYILAMGLCLWLPLAWLINGSNPLTLFWSPSGMGATLMFIVGSIIANATAVGGGMIFNPTLQIAFGVSGLSALSLAVLVQCAGMASGCYGWYRKGQFNLVPARQLLLMVGIICGCVLVFNSLFIFLLGLFPKGIPVIMKVALSAISLYVAGIVWANIRAAKGGADNQLVNPAKVGIDKKLYPWLVLGAAMNVSTSVGAGELTFSHMIKYYGTPAKTAVAIGTLMQAAAVWTQAGFILFFFREYIDIRLVLIGLIACLAGGRLAPWILTRPLIEPYAKHILAMTALTMGVVAAWTLLPY